MDAWKPTDLGIGGVVNGEGAVCGLDFHRDGRYLVMSTRDTSVHLIDSLAGTEKKKLYTRAHGSGDVKFTHHDACVLLTSDQAKGNKNCEIRYLCMYDNRYLRFFKSHTAPVASIAMSPQEDSFLSAAVDGSVCMWNLSAPGPMAKFQLPQYISSPMVQYDGGGVIFGIMGTDERTKLHNIKLFDVRNYKEPFAEIVPQSSMMEAAITKALNKSQLSLTKTGVSRLLQVAWTGFEFSPDGNHIMVNTVGENIFILDGFKSSVEPVVIATRKNENNLTLGACFSADGKHIISGNEDNDIQIFDLAGDQKNQFTGHVSPVTFIKANPKYDVIASGCVNTVLWIRSNGEASAGGGDAMDV